MGAGLAGTMAVVWSANLKRRFYAPGFSGASIFVVLVFLSLIIASFLIAYYSEGESPPEGVAAWWGHRRPADAEILSWWRACGTAEAERAVGASPEQAYGSRRALTASSRKWNLGRSSQCASSAKTRIPGPPLNWCTGACPSYLPAPLTHRLVFHGKARISPPSTRPYP